MKSAKQDSPGAAEREGRVLSGRLSMNVLEGEIIGWRFWVDRGVHWREETQCQGSCHPGWLGGEGEEADTHCTTT